MMKTEIDFINQKIDLINAKLINAQGKSTPEDWALVMSNKMEYHKILEEISFLDYILPKFNEVIENGKLKAFTLVINEDDVYAFETIQELGGKNNGNKK